jgi:hypothetical protein
MSKEPAPSQALAFVAEFDRSRQQLLDMVMIEGKSGFAIASATIAEFKRLVEFRDSLE